MFQGLLFLVYHESPPPSVAYLIPTFHLLTALTKDDLGFYSVEVTYAF